MDPISILGSISGLATTVWSMLGNLRDLEDDQQELQQLTQQVRAIVDDPATQQAVRSNTRSVQQALEGMQQALTSLHQVVEKLAQKSELKKFLRAGDYRARLQGSARKLHDSMGTLSAVLSLSNTNNGQQVIQHICDLQSSINAMELRMLAQFEQHACSVEQSMNTVMVERVGKLGAGIDNLTNISQQLLSALETTFPAALHSLLEDKQALAKELQDLRDEAQQLRAEKEQQEALCLEQVIAALDSGTSAAPTTAPTTAPP